MGKSLSKAEREKYFAEQSSEILPENEEIDLIEFPLNDQSLQNAEDISCNQKNLSNATKRKLFEDEDDDKASKIMKIDLTGASGTNYNESKYKYYETEELIDLTQDFSPKHNNKNDSAVVETFSIIDTVDFVRNEHEKVVETSVKVQKYNQELTSRSQNDFIPLPITPQSSGELTNTPQLNEEEYWSLDDDKPMPAVQKPSRHKLQKRYTGQKAKKKIRRLKNVYFSLLGNASNSDDSGQCGNKMQRGDEIFKKILEIASTHRLEHEIRDLITAPNVPIHRQQNFRNPSPYENMIQNQNLRHQQIIAYWENMASIYPYDYE